jgi:hypothetical protein
VSVSAHWRGEARRRGERVSGQARVTAGAWRLHEGEHVATPTRGGHAAPDF